ncbi:MAG TPA: DCC1-like thiol-disulfide oxidoreductase family protein, partial [Candidatus Saccharimonadales bacterium]|nr:DCC1-like thiol-disulfide oxidoreductase family protein [Candidatus Saccharimonadales bacterium]
MNTEIPDKAADPVRGWVLYDGECSLCTGAVVRFASMLQRHRFGLAPLQAPWALQQLGLKPSEQFTEMKMLADDGKVYGGADALLQIARKIWWAWPLFAVSLLPGVRPLLRACYRQMATHRNCSGNSCKIRQRRFLILDWVPLFALPPAAWFITFRGPAWITTWALVLSIVFGFKWAIWRKAARRFGRIRFARSVGFLFWPGMDVEPFLDEIRKRQQIQPREWLAAITKILFGAALVWTAPRLFIVNQALLAGWIGMVGLVFVLHFGFFHLLELIWRRAGVAVEPIMRAPILSQSLGEFWGQRWNLAFSQLAHDFGFMPLRRRLGIVGATLIVFAASGLIHELVISIPAR